MLPPLFLSVHYATVIYLTFPDTRIIHPDKYKCKRRGRSHAADSVRCSTYAEDCLLGSLFNALHIAVISHLLKLNGPAQLIAFQRLYVIVPIGINVQIANGQDKLIYSAIGDRYFYFDSFSDAVDRFNDPAVQARIADLRPKLDAYIASDRSPIVEKRPFISPARQAYGSFYQPLDDHILTMQQEAARMPEGYPITLKAKVKDF